MTLPMQRTFFFLSEDEAKSSLFCIYHPAKTEFTKGKVRGMIVYIHPFAEEMNRSRHMAAQQARSFASNGFAVLQMDLTGCGDSAGEFGDATWEAWIEDILYACQWIEDKVSQDFENNEKPKLWLWGLRAGCLLAAEVAQKINRPCSLLFWQPTICGKTFYSQFRRLQLTSNILSRLEKTNQAFNTKLNRNHTNNILGYSISHELEKGLVRAFLVPPLQIQHIFPVVWMEMSRVGQSEISPISNKVIQDWGNTGIKTLSYLVEGPSFWSSSELVSIPELIALTTEVVECET